MRVSLATKILAGGTIFMEKIEQTLDSREVAGMVEKDKDKFLKASRLERRERKPIVFEDLVTVLFFITVWLAMILFFIGTK